MNDISFSYRELSRLLRGRWLRAPQDLQAKITAVTDDSRQVAALAASGESVLFCAIDGKEYGLPQDGHQYLQKAAEAGAACLLSQREEIEILGDVPVLFVPNGLAAFQKLAKEHCRRMQEKGVLVVGITGSCGKTSSKEMCASILGQHFGPEHVIKTEGNTNNDFGVPRNLFRINSQTKAAVIEAGSNHQGEIRRLVKMIQPKISFICNIGDAHLEAFHSREGVAKEKGELFAGTALDGICILPKECDGEDILRKKAGQRKILTFGYSEKLRDPADIVTETPSIFPDKEMNFTLLVHDNRDKEGNHISVLWKLGGGGQASNAAGAVAVGLCCGATLSECQNGLEQCKLPENRMEEMVDARNVHWVNDAYNANPTSMIEGLNWFEQLTIAAGFPCRHIILGEMRELGEQSQELHNEIFEYVMESLMPQDKLYLIGEGFTSLFEECFDSFSPVFLYKDLEEFLANHGGKFVPKKGDWVFLKGSNGVRLFELYPGYQKK